MLNVSIIELAKKDKCPAPAATIVAVGIGQLSQPTAMAFRGHLHPYSLQTASEAKSSRTQTC